MKHSTLAKNAWLFLEFYLLVEEDFFSLFQLQLEISELKEKVQHLEHEELQKMDNGPSQQMIEELLQKLSSLEKDLEVEKGEKESIIHEIVNLQEVLKKKEEEIQICEENLKATQDALSNEQADREALGEQARQKLQELEENEHKLDLKVKELTREVERWKKEVDMHVEAESRLMENRKEEESTPTPADKQEPKTEQHTPSGTFALTLISGDKKSRQTLRAFSIC